MAAAVSLLLGGIVALDAFSVKSIRHMGFKGGQK
jgi:hypothetical protein